VPRGGRGVRRSRVGRLCRVCLVEAAPAVCVSWSPRLPCASRGARAWCVCLVEPAPAVCVSWSPRLPCVSRGGRACRVRLVEPGVFRPRVAAGHEPGRSGSYRRIASALLAGSEDPASIRKQQETRPPSDSNRRPGARKDRRGAPTSAPRGLGLPRSRGSRSRDGLSALRRRTGRWRAASRNPGQPPTMV